MTIVEFLRARLDEDEQAALAATPGRWWARPQRVDRAVYSVQAVGALNGMPALGIDSLRDAEHIARHDPARVLADVEAKRRIVDLAANYSPELEHGDNGEWAFAEVLHQLAGPFAEHPDYDPSWPPS